MEGEPTLTDLEAGLRIYRAFRIVRDGYDNERRACAEPARANRFHRDAIADFEHAIRVAPGEPGPGVQAALGLGLAHLRLGHRQRAIRALRLAVRFGREDGASYLYRERAERLLQGVLKNRHLLHRQSGPDLDAAEL